MWLCCVFTVAPGLSPIVANGGLLSPCREQLLVAVASLSMPGAAAGCGGFSRRGAGSGRPWSSLAVAHGLQRPGSVVALHRLGCPIFVRSSDPGMEPVSPALAAGFPTTGPAVKPQTAFLFSFLSTSFRSS